MNKVEKEVSEKFIIKKFFEEDKEEVNIEFQWSKIEEKDENSPITYIRQE